MSIRIPDVRFRVFSEDGDGCHALEYVSGEGWQMVHTGNANYKLFVARFLDDVGKVARLIAVTETKTYDPWEESTTVYYECDRNVSLDIEHSFREPE